LTRQTNPPEIRAQENERNGQAMATRRTDPSYRILEQNADTNRRRLTRQTNPPEIRAQENENNAQAMATRHTDLAYRIPEQIADTNQRRLARTDPANRIPGQIADTNQKRLARTDPANRIPEQIADTNQRRLAREQLFFFMKWQLSSILQVAHTYIISLVGYGMKNVVMGVGTFICQVQQVQQKRNFVQMVLCLLLVTTLMKN
jgi:hypothetical protein